MLVIIYTCSLVNSFNTFGISECAPYGPLGMEDGRIGDSQITASSYLTFLGFSLEPKYARLKGSKYWAADELNDPHWIQVDFLVSVEISGIQIKGDGRLGRTETLQVAYGDSEDPLVSIEDESGNSKVRQIFIIFIL